MMTASPTERQGEVVGGRKHKECYVVSEGGQQERRDGIVGCQKVLGGKERSWTRMTCRDTRKAARKHKGLHHAILERTRETAQEPGVHTMQLGLLEVPPLFVLLEYCLGML